MPAIVEASLWPNRANFRSTRFATNGDRFGPHAGANPTDLFHLLFPQITGRMGQWRQSAAPIISPFC